MCDFPYPDNKTHREEVTSATSLVTQLLERKEKIIAKEKCERLF